MTWMRATDEQLVKLAALQEGTPVLGARAAQTHGERGWGCPTPDELQEVLDALDDWTSGDRHIMGTAQPRDPAYGRVVTALTRFDIALCRVVRT